MKRSSLCCFFIMLTSNVKHKCIVFIVMVLSKTDFKRTSCGSISSSNFRQASSSVRWFAWSWVARILIGEYCCRVRPTKVRSMLVWKGGTCSTTNGMCIEIGPEKKKKDISHSTSQGQIDLSIPEKWKGLISKEGRKEGRNWVLSRFQQLRSYRDEIETRNLEEIPYSSRIFPMGLSVAEGP